MVCTGAAQKWGQGPGVVLVIRWEGEGHRMGPGEQNLERCSKQVTHLFFRVVWTVPELMNLQELRGRAGCGGGWSGGKAWAAQWVLGEQVPGNGGSPAGRPVTHQLLLGLPKQWTSSGVRG